MADCIFEKITQNLLDAIHGKSITIAGVSRTLTCERERTVDEEGNRYPLVLLFEPHVDKISRAHRTYHVRIYYHIEFYDKTINDTFSTTETVTPIGKVYGNVASDLMRLIADDGSRGRLAVETNYEMSDIAFDTSSGIPDACVLLEVSVEAMVRDTDFYNTGG